MSDTPAPGGKILIAILGLDQHELGALSIAAALRDAGREVIYNGRFNLPPAVVETAIQEDVALIALAAHSWEYLYMIDDLLDGLRERGLDIPVVVGGSVITPSDAETLRKKGVAGAYGPSSTLDQVVADITALADGARG